MTPLFEAVLIDADGVGPLWCLERQLSRNQEKHVKIATNVKDFFVEQDRVLHRAIAPRIRETYMLLVSEWSLVYLAAYGRVLGIWQDLKQSNATSFPVERLMAKRLERGILKVHVHGNASTRRAY